MKVNFYGPARSQSQIQQVIIDIFDSPLNTITEPVSFIDTEAGERIALEEGTFDIDMSDALDQTFDTLSDTPIEGTLSGTFVNESTPDDELVRGPAARITTTAAPEQDPVPSDHVIATTTIEENI
jgi:hypothetical protein